MIQKLIGNIRKLLLLKNVSKLSVNLFNILIFTKIGTKIFQKIISKN